MKSNPIALPVLLIAAVFVGVVADADEMKAATNIPYLEGANYADDKDKLDVYSPEYADGAPVLVFIHGGGLLRGDKSGQAHVGERFTRAGFVTVCINHRLSPGVSHPAHAQDAAAALAWVFENIATYGGDPDKIFLTGHSAGAYLAALIALDGKYLAAHGLSPGKLRGVIPISGFFHVDRLAPSRPKSVWGTDENVWLEASPSQYVSKDAPPMLFLYADGDADDRRQESVDIVRELKDAGHMHASNAQVSDRTHITIWQRLNAEDDETSRRMVDFVSEILAGSGS